MIWQAENTVKILQEERYKKSEASHLTLRLFQNETESLQLVITPECDVKEFGVAASKLQCGKEYLPDTAVQIFVTKYIEVTKSSADTQSETGFYPDALLPIQTSIKYGENKIKANHNQSVWIQVKTQTQTVAGDYIGKVTITIDGKIFVLPVCVTVWNYALPTKNHTKQLFIISNQEMQRGEGDKSLSLIKRYYDKALEYRINGNNLPYNHRTGNEDEGIKEYIKTLKEYHFNPRCSVFNIPHSVNATWDDLNYERIEKLFDAIADECFSDGENYFLKFVAYIWILDEPHLSKERMQYCKKVLPKFECFKQRLGEKYSVKNTVFAKTIGETVKNLPVIITCGVNSELLPDKDNEYHITYCPAFGSWSQDENVRILKRLNPGEKWWYGCDWPAPPSPTYHIDDNLLSARLLSWMQFENEITGNLYWRMNYCKKVIDGVDYPPDPYGYASPNRNANGDGFLVYPGKPYGLDCFVPSIRLESIRDGIEDYEALYALQEIWRKCGARSGVSPMPVREALKPLFTRLYENSRMLKKLYVPFEKAREMLAKWLIAADKYAFYILSIEKGEYKFFTLATEVLFNGKALQGIENIYTLQLQEEENEIMLCGEYGEIAVPVYKNSIEHRVNYNISYNWATTEERYKIKNCNPESLLEPYYKILGDTNEDKIRQCVYDLNKLMYFTWRTEAVIQKHKLGRKTEIIFTLPNGILFSSVPFQKNKLDENAAEYRFLTDKSTLSVSVKTEKYTSEVTLYL